MSILVTGSAGVIGTQVLNHFAGNSAEVFALTRSPEKAQLPAGIAPVQGDLTDINALRRAMNGIGTLFLLAPNAPDEFTQALQALSVAREAKVRASSTCRCSRARNTLTCRTFRANALPNG